MTGDPSIEDRIRIHQRVLEPERRLLTLTLTDGAILEMAPDAPEAVGLEPGQVLEAEQRVGLQRAAARRQVAREVFRLLDRRAFTRAQLADRLQARGFASDAVDPVLDDCERHGLIDDAAFARGYCRDQLLRKPVGRSWLRHRLRKAGVDETVVEQALDEVLSSDEEMDRARRALASRSRNLTDEKGKARAFRFLVSRGFSESVARRVVFDAAAQAAAGRAGAADVD